MNRSSGHPERRVPARRTRPSLSAARRAVLHDAVLLRGVRLRRRGRDRAAAPGEGSTRPRRGGGGPRRAGRATSSGSALLPVVGAVVLVLVIGWLLLGACGSSSGAYKDYVGKVNVVVEQSNTSADSSTTR